MGITLHECGRKVIEPGVYGRLIVNGTHRGVLTGKTEVLLGLLDRQELAIECGNFSAAEIRAAAATLIEIADALDEGTKP